MRQRKVGGVGEVDGGGGHPCVREKEKKEDNTGFKYELVALI
jgi:hypothetical protein